MNDTFKARKKPIEVDAWEVAYNQAKNIIPEWANNLTEWRNSVDEPPLLCCYCETGIQTARVGDFLVRGYLDEVSPIPRSIFLGSYERV